MTTPQDAYEAAISKLVHDFKAAVAVQATHVHVQPGALTKACISELLGEERYADGRAVNWSVRLRLYDRLSPDDPEVDSDPRLAPDAPGATIVRGLPAVLTLVASQASAYHGAACAGLDMATLKRKYRNVRSQICNRGDGTGTIRADYQVGVNGDTRHMLLRCDVQRMGNDTPAAGRSKGYQ